MGRSEASANHAIKYALIVACTAYHIDKFAWGQIHILQKLGFEVHVAASFNLAFSGNSSADYIKWCRENFTCHGVKVFELPFTRFPISLNNIKAFRLLKKQLNIYPYSLLHCHTPTGGVVARIGAARWRKAGMPVIYTAHGFHFFKGAPLINWLLYFPIEWFLARITDYLIVINEEDDKIARKMPVKSVIRMNGVGVSRRPYKKVVPMDKKTLGLFPDAFVFLCVGELSKRKNQGQLIRSFAVAIRKCTNAVLLLAGEGAMRLQYEQLTNALGLTEKVFFLGWRDDIPKLVMMADVIVSSAKQEGLPVSLIEAIIAGKPIIASPCRGNRELAEQAGIVADGEKELSDAITLLYENSGLCAQLGQSAKIISKQYEDVWVDAEAEKLYSALVESESNIG